MDSNLEGQFCYFSLQIKINNYYIEYLFDGSTLCWKTRRLEEREWGREREQTRYKFKIFSNFLIFIFLLNTIKIKKIKKKLISWKFSGVTHCLYSRSAHGWYHQNHCSVVCLENIKKIILLNKELFFEMNLKHLLILFNCYISKQDMLIAISNKWSIKGTNCTFFKSQILSGINFLSTKQHISPNINITRHFLLCSQSPFPYLFLFSVHEYCTNGQTVAKFIFFQFKIITVVVIYSNYTGFMHRPIMFYSTLMCQEIGIF